MAATDADSVFARRLRELRNDARLTQRELAELMTGMGTKMHQSAIAKIESGDRPVTIGEAVRFARVLGVPLEHLLADPEGSRDLVFIEARLAVASLQRELAARTQRIDELGVLREAAVKRLEAAQRRLGELAEVLGPRYGGGGPVPGSIAAC